MVSTKNLRRWLIAAPITGPLAALSALFAIAVPTLVNVWIKTDVTDLPLMPYIPFILLAAILLGWRYAALVAMASAIVSDLWLIGVHGQSFESPAHVFAFASFMFVAAILVTFVAAVRRLAGFNIPPARSRRTQGNIIFSLEDGVAWASWYGTKEPICLGDEDEVAAMMEDFLAQRELGRRLVASLS